MIYIPYFSKSVLLTGAFTAMLIAKLLTLLSINGPIAFIVGLLLMPTLLVNLGDSEPPLIKNDLI